MQITKFQFQLNLNIQQELLLTVQLKSKTRNEHTVLCVVTQSQVSLCKCLKTNLMNKIVINC